jgi:hypothetical protein
MTHENPELYFYDELPPDERAAFETHLASCAECRTALAELASIRAALEPARDDAERSPFEWHAFMRRLERRLDDVQGHAAGPRRPVMYAVLALAATLVVGIAVGALWQRERSAAVTGRAPVSAASTASAPANRAAVLAAADHFRRAKLVLLGLASKDPAAAGAADWAYERALAASLLPDTRLHRLAALEAGEAGLADLLGDLELLLLQASYAERPDRTTLTRLQRFINRRDLFVRMEIGL